jgi:hypothetical protein
MHCGGVSTAARSMVEWQEPRERWEYSHLARADMTVPGLVVLVVAIS